MVGLYDQRMAREWTQKQSRDASSLACRSRAYQETMREYMEIGTADRKAHGIALNRKILRPFSTISLWLPVGAINRFGHLPIRGNIAFTMSTFDQLLLPADTAPLPWIAKA